MDLVISSAFGSSNEGGQLIDEKSQGKRSRMIDEEVASAIACTSSDHLHRQLKARHLSMIALGGALGTGLIIGTGSGLARGGPAAILITYSLVGFVVFLVLSALGEIATWLPLASGFTGYAARYVDPAMGFALGYCYWFKYLILPPTQLTAAALVLEYWVPRDIVNPGVWIAIFLVVIFGINMLGIKFFGELEFCLSGLKIVIVTGLLLLSLILVCGGGPDHDVKGFKYWSNPGAFNHFIQDGITGEFLASISCLVTATYAYLGTELIAVTFGEAENPRRNIPKAIRLTFYRIVVFYILSVLFLGMLVPYQSSELLAANKASTSASASPFTVAIKLSGIQVLPAIFNACVLIFVFSAANSDLYIASRTIYGLAVSGYAPNFLAHTNKDGVPVYGLILSASFGCLGFLNVSQNSAQIFTYFVNLVTIFGILTWLSLLVCHLFFVRARKAQGVQNHELAYAAPFGVYGTYFALFICGIIAIFKNFSVFVHSSATGGSYGSFDYTNFITGYLGIPVYFMMFIGYKIYYRTEHRQPLTTDLRSGKQEVDDEELMFVEREKVELETDVTKVGTWYKFISWLV